MVKGSETETGAVSAQGGGEKVRGGGVYSEQDVLFAG